MSTQYIPFPLDSSGHIISPFYEYTPTQSVCYIFVVLFGISTLLHLGQSLRFRAWWLLPTAVLAGFGEVLGWSGRLWSSYSPLNQTPFMIQIVCTIIAPTPLVGAIFMTFARMSARMGEKYGRLSARLYSRIFFTCDIIALFIQAAGGGIAASTQDIKVAQTGANIMLAGIIFQLASLTVFSILAAEYLVRYMQDRRRSERVGATINLSSETLGSTQEGMDRSLKILFIGVCFETLFLYIRAIYRTIELAGGWNGRIITTQVYFNVLDGAMVVVAIFVMNAFHPAKLISAADKRLGSTSIRFKSTDDLKA